MDALEHELREELIEITNRLSSRGLIRAAGGNLSVRLNESEILITPTRLAKGYLREEDIVVVDMQGHPLRGDFPPSMVRLWPPMKPVPTPKLWYMRIP